MSANSEPTRSPAEASSWLEERTRARSLADALLHVRIPAEARTLYFGGIALFLFAIQVATGTLLALYYKPTPEAAYDSVLFIMSDVSFGWLIRSVHHWASTLMILFVLLHLLRVFFQGAYKYPRELTWVVGIGLVGITMVFGFTGYLLPWDQRAYWATVVGTEIAGNVPGIGEQLMLLLRGGVDVTEATLSRFFGIHVLVLPLALAGLLVVHLTLVHQLGLANPKRPDPRDRPPEGRTTPFFPNYVLDELIAWYILFALLVVLASLFPAGLEGQANPLETPPHTKPEWYYLAVYELLKLVPRIVGIMIPVVGVLLLTVLPFLDRNPEVLARRRKLAVAGATLVLGALVVLTIQGFVS
ncbi:MAG: cytochrome bc complex cytochrome b subunit [Chloroflexota bacterium]